MKILLEYLTLIISFNTVHLISQKTCLIPKSPEEIQLESIDSTIAEWTSIREIKLNYDYIADHCNVWITELKQVREKLVAMPDQASEESLTQIRRESDSINKVMWDFFYDILPLEYRKLITLGYAGYQMTLSNDSRMPSSQDIVAKIMNIIELEDLHRVTDNQAHREQIEEQLAEAYDRLQAATPIWKKTIDNNRACWSFCPVDPKQELRRMIIQRPGSGRCIAALHEIERKMYKAFRQYARLLPVDNGKQVQRILPVAAAFHSHTEALKTVVCSTSDDDLNHWVRLYDDFIGLTEHYDE